MITSPDFIRRNADTVFEYCIVPIKKKYCAADRIQAYLKEQPK